MANRYNSLLIDLDDTLLDFSGDESKAIKAVLENNGIPFSDDVLELYSEINDNGHTFVLGEEITAKSFITNHFVHLLKLLEVKGERAKSIADEYYELMLKSHKLKSGVLKTLKYLKYKGYKLYVTSNGYPEFQYKRIKDAKISSYFNGIFISEEIGLRKPSRSFFEYVIRHIPESNRSKILVIGDAPAADVFGGINSKLATCWLKNGDKQCKHKPDFTINSITGLMDIL